MTKETRGGTRKNSGRKLKFGESSIGIWIRVPKSKVLEIKEKIKEILKKYE
jgi:hypothetical protein